MDRGMGQVSTLVLFISFTKKKKKHQANDKEENDDDDEMGAAWKDSKKGKLRMAWKTMKTNLEPWKTMKKQPGTMKNH